MKGVWESYDGNYRVSIRGERKAGNVLVLIDGSPINDFYSGLSIYDFPRFCQLVVCTFHLRAGVVNLVKIGPSKTNNHYENKVHTARMPEALSNELSEWIFHQSGFLWSWQN